MAESKKRVDGLVVAVVTMALVLVPLAAYVVGYFQLGTWYNVDAVIEVREFKRQWQATIYGPAGRIEKMLTWKNVTVIGPITNYPTPLPDGIDPTGVDH